MVKVRLQGTKQDINWFIERVLKNNNEVKVLDISETFAIESLSNWISWQTATCQGHTGWIGWIYPGGVPK